MITAQVCVVSTQRMPVTYILSANIYRRNLTKGQAAMVMAKARLVSSQSTRQVAMVMAKAWAFSAQSMRETLC
jgi:hypothetical protein